MDLFPDGAFVRLQSRVHRTYLHADEDGVSITLRPERRSLNAVWRVHQILRGDVPYVLLYGTAYGRYLFGTDRRAPLVLHGHRVVQGYYDYPDEIAVQWFPVRVVGPAAGDEQVVLLHHAYRNRILRANGLHFRWVRTGVSLDSYFSRSPMMHWVVQTIPPLPEVPIFPPPTAPPASAQPRRGILSLFRRRTQRTTYRRTIWFMRADANGNFNDQGWREIRFDGRSAFNLRMAVTQQRREHYYFFYVTLCAWGGRCGRLTPLTADLPRSQAPMEVVAINVNSPLDLALRYPNLEEPTADTS